MSESENKTEVVQNEFNPTYQKVKNIFEEALTRIEEGKPINLKELQIKHGYSESSAEGYAVKRTKAWNQLLEQKAEDDLLLDKLNEIALEAEKDSDAIRAIKELFKLKNRYPDKVSKTYSVQQKIDSLKK